MRFVNEAGAAQAAAAALTYEEYYGFEHAPFTLAPDPQFLYLGASHGQAIESLRGAVARRDGFAVLTGEVGTGKTTLARALRTRLDRTAFVSLILNPFLSIDELLREVLLDFGVVSKEDVRSGRAAATSRQALVRALRDFLSSIASLGGHGVLILDEAQHLPFDALEQVRLLASDDGPGQEPLQVVLLGQPSLLEALAQPSMQAFASRVSHRLRLSPLSREEVEGYVAHRLQVGRSATTVAFTTGAIDELHGLSRGVPRLLNLLCDRALLISAREHAREVDRDAIRGAGVTLGLVAVEPAPAPARRWRRWATTTAMVAVAAAAVVAFAPLADWIRTPLPDLPGSPHVALATPAEAHPVPPLDEVPAGPPSPVFRAF